MVHKGGPRQGCAAAANPTASNRVAPRQPRLGGPAGVPRPHGRRALRGLPVRRDHGGHRCHQSIWLVVHAAAVGGRRRRHLHNVAHAHVLQPRLVQLQGRPRGHQDRGDVDRGREGEAVRALGGAPVERVCEEGGGAE